MGAHGCRVGERENGVSVNGHERLVGVKGDGGNALTLHCSEDCTTL